MIRRSPAPGSVFCFMGALWEQISEYNGGNSLFEAEIKQKIE